MPYHKLRNPLRISAAPFKPSFLSIPPSPFSPRTPLTPVLPNRQRDEKTNQQSVVVYPKPPIEAPTSPLSWMWKCHQCRHSYRLGVTRRCLEDGHHFCSGATAITTVQKSSSPRKSRKHRACASKFDYSGWKTVGRWRRGGPKCKAITCTGSQADSQDKLPRQQDCWNMCDYPSECRWGKRFGIHTPVETSFPSIEVTSMPSLTAPVNFMPRSTLTRRNCGNIHTPRQADKTDFWGTLLASAERRKSAGERGASQLSNTMEKNKTQGQGGNTPDEKNSDGDVAMETIDPALLDRPGNTPLSIHSDTSTVGSFRALVSRTRYRRVKSHSKVHSTTDKNCVGQKPMVPRHVTTELDDQVRLNDSDMLIEGFAPLHRVQSRGAGYQSCSV